MAPFEASAWVAHVLAFVESMQGWTDSLRAWWSGTMNSGAVLMAPVSDVTAALAWAWQWIPMPLRYVLLFGIALGVLRFVMMMFGYGKTLIKWW